MMGIFNWISSVGAWALSGVRTLGNFSRFLFRLVVNLGPSFTRFQDTLNQLYFVGNYSLVIILVSGLFVGFVLGLQRAGARRFSCSVLAPRAGTGGDGTSFCGARRYVAYGGDRFNECR